MSGDITMGIHRVKNIRAKSTYFEPEFSTLALKVEYEDWNGGKHQFDLTLFCDNRALTQSYADAINAVKLAIEPEVVELEPQS